MAPKIVLNKQLCKCSLQLVSIFFFALKYSMDSLYKSF